MCLFYVMFYTHHHDIYNPHDIHIYVCVAVKDINFEVAFENLKLIPWVVCFPSYFLCPSLQNFGQKQINGAPYLVGEEYVLLFL